MRASARSSSVWRASSLALLVLGCRESPRPADASPAPSASAPAVTATPPPPAPPPPAPACAPYDVASAKSVGHTSVVFKITTKDGRKAAWKPDAVRRRHRYRGEVAAYRLARALGLDHVPLACLAPMRVTELGKLPSLSDLAVEDGVVRGAAIPWIEGLRFLDLEKPPPEALALQLATMVGFDFLTGNWDRYSGGNVGLDVTGTRVLFIDNDAAFMAGAPADALAKNRARVVSTPRFPRAFVSAVAQLDAPALLRALGEEDGAPLLPASIVDAVVRRARDFTDLVAAKGDAALAD